MAETRFWRIVLHWARISTYELYGIPEGLVITVFMFLFAAALSPYLPNTKLGGVSIPNISSKKFLLLVKYVAPPISLLLLVGFLPLNKNWPKRASDAPKCLINASWESETKYRISWIVHGDAPSLVKLNNKLVENEGHFSFDFSDYNEYERFVIYGFNQWGECAGEARVENNDNNRPGFLTCSIAAEPRFVAENQWFKVQWTIQSDFPVESTINDANVVKEDWATYQIGPRKTSTFNLRAVNSINECEASVRIQKIVE